MNNAVPARPEFEPLRKSITVNLSVVAAFELFTEGLDRWWPYKKYSVSGERTASCLMEPRQGGRVYELRDDGETFDWGKVLAWEPPHRLVLAWHPGRDSETAQEVEFRFTEQQGATRIDLEHRGWASLGDQARDIRANYAGGWETVLAKFLEAAGQGA